MRKTILLVVVSLILILPSALALNCTKYEGDKHELCNNIDPLDISESDKRALMGDGVYGPINPSNPSVNLELNLTNNSPITLEMIYEEKIVFITKFLLFLLFNYLLFSMITKSKFIRKWLTADS